MLWEAATAPIPRATAPLQPPPGSSLCQTLSWCSSTHPRSPSLPASHGGGHLQHLGELMASSTGWVREPVGQEWGHRPPLLLPHVPPLLGLLL